MLAKGFFLIFIILNIDLCFDKLCCELSNYNNQFIEEVIQNGTEIDSTASMLTFKTKSSYSTERRAIIQTRNRLKLVYSQLKTPIERESYLDSTSIMFTDFLLNNIVPHWYGTPWSFEGHTAVPNQGEIACGYFVSTTMKHMGLNLNRYRLAQQAPYYEAKSLAIDTSQVIVFRSDGLVIQDSFFSDFQEGLYFVGLDSHVGYLYVKNGIPFFLTILIIE